MNLYLRLAVSGMKKNRQLYFPYIITSAGMVMVFYIIQALSFTPVLGEMEGGRNIVKILTLGKYVIAAFSVMFLLYTNSFLSKRRNKELGLYNILGVDKWKICRITAWESVIVSFVAIAGGIVAGIALSKFSELGLLNAVKTDINYDFYISFKAIGITFAIFIVIFFVLYIKSLVNILRTKPIELMQSVNAGEKPPKANWIPALLGMIILIAAYCMAVSIKNPINALLAFFVAVILVIIATYMLFVAGSVAVCRLLQKNKKYYYKKNHFVSVSSMTYRMRRNGAGLASICILSTIVLVMVSSTTSLYFGREDSLRTRYPYDCEIIPQIEDFNSYNEEYISGMRNELEKVYTHYDAVPYDVLEYRYMCIVGGRTEDGFEYDSEALAGMMDFGSVVQIVFLTTNDYNNMTGDNINVAPGEAYVATSDCDYEQNEYTFGGSKLKITGRLDEVPYIGNVGVGILPTVLFVISSTDEIRQMAETTDNNGNKYMELFWYYGYDIDIGDSDVCRLYEEQIDCLIKNFASDERGFDYSGACKEAERKDFITTYGGFFFLGILLSIIFIFAAGLIMYYKQISEGYEDCSRFEIMQKVGMTKADIKKSINSQVLTVFFAPLLLAGIHLMFAYPLLWRMLKLFGLSNLGFVIGVTLVTYIAFGLFYVLIYKVTSRSYYNIVSG